MKRFTRIGTHRGPLFWGGLCSELAKVGTESSSLGQQGSFVTWCGQRGKCWALTCACKLSALPDQVAPCGDPYTHQMPLKLKRSPAPHFDLKASWQNMASFPPPLPQRWQQSVGCAHTAAIKSWGWADLMGVFSSRPSPEPT